MKKVTSSMGLGRTDKFLRWAWGGLLWALLIFDLLLFSFYLIFC